MLKLDQSIDEALNYLISKRQDDGGFPAVKSSDQTGIWTTAETIRAICSLKPAVGRDWLNPSVLYIINAQYPDGSWHLIAGPPGATMSTADALMALLEIKGQNLVNPPLITKLERAIEEGFRWLHSCQNKDGGWGIEHRPSSEEGMSRIFSTYYALRALYKSGDNSSTAVNKGLDYILLTENEDGGWGFYEKGESNISSTARAVQVLTESEHFHVDSSPVKRGIRYLLQHKDHLSDTCVSEELITRAGGLLSLDNYTPYDMLRVFLVCRCPDVKVLQLVKWFMGTQQSDGRWCLRCQCSDKSREACMWVTTEAALVLAQAKRLFEAHPTFMLRCLLSNCPSLAIQERLIELLDGRAFTNIDKLFELTPEIVLDRSLDLSVTSQLLEAIFDTFEYINIYASEEHRDTVALSWATIANNSNDLEIRVKGYSYAGSLRTRGNERDRLSGKGRFLDALLDMKKGEVNSSTFSKLQEALTLTKDTEEIGIIKKLIEFVNNFLNFERETDPMIGAFRGGNALVMLRDVETLSRKLPSIAPLIGQDFSIHLEKRINEGLTSISEKAKSVIVSEIKGTFKEGLAGTLRCIVRSLGLPVNNVVVTLETKDNIVVSDNKRQISFVGCADTEFLFTVTPRQGGKLRVPLFICFNDFNGERHETRTEHEILVERRTDRQVEVGFVEIINPYSYGPAILSPEMFYGRKDKLREIRNSIKSTNQPYAVVGQRRIGKTSFLRALKADLEQEHAVCVLLDLQMISPKKSVLFLDQLGEQTLLALSESPLKEKVPQKTLFKRVSEALSIIKEIEVMSVFKIGMDKPEVEKEQLAFKRAAAIMKTYSSILSENGYKCVAMLDEIGELAEYEGADTLLSFMRGLIQALPQFVFIVAGPDILFELTSYKRPFFNLFEKVPLHGLKEDEAEELLTKPIPQVHYEDDVFEYVYKITGGNPFYVQAICKRIVGLLNREKRYQVTVADAKSVVDILVEELDDQSRFQWKDTNTYEHLILASIAGFEGLCDSTQIIDKIRSSLKEHLKSTYLPAELSGAIQRLIEKGYIFKSGTNYKFADDIFRRWVNLHFPLTDVAKEEVSLGNNGRMVVSHVSAEPNNA
ncbi:MAG: prenyltransferase/squalene oxidase repeat-containing protein [Candidatus Roizmanbacteria bacterium]|nr:prenyltransferase/squalene oxidase repeat-containing protein [Candidatus Roizmanbacteria bacterium]